MIRMDEIKIMEMLAVARKWEPILEEDTHSRTPSL